MTRAFVVDLLFIPFTACGAVVAFVREQTPGIFEYDVAARESAIAFVALVLNAVAVLVQTRGQVGLKTRPDRSDAPRSVVTGAYSIWAFAFVGLSSGFDALWGGMVVLTIAAVVLSIGVTKAHEEEPTLECGMGGSRPPSHPVWHIRGVWSLHEDFHLVLVIADAVWLAMAVRFIFSR